jgi:hypothetical protein
MGVPARLVGGRTEEVPFPSRPLGQDWTPRTTVDCQLVDSGRSLESAACMAACGWTAGERRRRDYFDDQAEAAKVIQAGPLAGRSRWLSGLLPSLPQWTTG